MRLTFLPLLLLATVAAAYVDEENEAVIIEAAGSRGGRQLWGGMLGGYPVVGRNPSGTPTAVHPASTQPLPMSPLASALCRTVTGQLAWCPRYVVPGIMGWPFGGQFAQPGGQFQQPGIQFQQPGGQFQQPGGQFQQPGGQFQQPGGQFQQPGGQFQQPGGQFQQPGGQFQQPGGQFQQPGGQFQQPGGQFQQPGDQFQQPGGQSPPPQETAPKPQPPTAAVIVEVEEEEEPQPERPIGGCGKGKYFPIRYSANGSVAEEVERLEEASGFKIVAGWDADQFEWPWIAALMSNGRQFCGGSLIDEKHILTAAHCVAHMTQYDVANLKVRLGEYKIKETGETQIFESKAAKVIRHKDFTKETLHKDVAIITMAEPLPASFTKIRPVCLPEGNQQYADQLATVIGWGSLRENGPQPNTLQEMTVKIWDNKRCKDTYKGAAPGGITEHMLCAGKQGKDSCSGDSGGPMQIGTGEYWTQIGIVSWGIGCGKSHYPGVYTRVTEVRDWIDRISRRY